MAFINFPLIFLRLLYMRSKSLLFLILALFCGFTSRAQQTNNIYQDALHLKAYCKTDANGKVSLSLADSAKWMPYLKKYVPAAYQVNYSKFLTYFDSGDFGLKALLPPVTTKGANGASDFTSAITPVSGTSSASATGFSTGNIANGLTAFIIKRAKEELTVAFFERFKAYLANHPEAAILFPKTAAFINQIDAYLYAGFLNTLKEGFLEDVNNVPYNLGAFLRSDRVRGFLGKNPAYQNAWLTVPVLCFLGDLNKGKAIADCIKDLYPDPELKALSPNYYNVLEFTVVLSESIRDTTGKSDWISFTEFQNAILNDPAISKKLFFGLLYESTKTISLAADGHMIFLNAYVDSTNEAKLDTILKTFGNAYTATKTAYKNLQDSLSLGKTAKVSTILNLVNVAVSDVKTSIVAINDLSSPAKQLSANTSLFFETVPRVTAIINNVYQKNYSAAVMNALILADQYIGKKDSTTKPFNNKNFLQGSLLNGANFSIVIDTALSRLKIYETAYPDDQTKIGKFVTELANARKTYADSVKRAEDTFMASAQNDDDVKALAAAIAPAVKKVSAIFIQIQAHTYEFNSSDLFQQILKYGSFMAAVAEAKNADDVSNAIEAAALPVGSSSIKYYSAVAISINSYIGGAYYAEFYKGGPISGTLNLPTAGVALPIGVNLSVSLAHTCIGKQIGSISLFGSVLDLGAVASYRLSNPQNVTSQNLPNFTWQNLLAPGGFIVLGRLFNTPIALGFGAQKGPELRQISYSGSTGTADISQNLTWRAGAFLSVDIPLFSLFSKPFKTQVTGL